MPHPNSALLGTPHRVEPNAAYRAIHRARVSSIRVVAPSHYQMRLEAPELAQSALPGQFVHLLTLPNADSWGFDPLLRRAFSIMSVNLPKKTAIDVLFRVEGKGTKALSTAVVGDKIDLIGPLGKPFDVSPFEFLRSGRNKSDETGKMFHVKQAASVAVLVGGGVGVPPLVYLSQYLDGVGIKCRAIVGARSQSEVIGRDELRAVCEKVELTTDDGSEGLHGRVTDVLPRLLKEAAIGGMEPIVYSCGPLMMLRAVAKICEQGGVRCQVSLEENMPCGIGVCNGCVVRARQPFASDGGPTADSGGEFSGEELSLNERVGNEWSPYHAYRRVCVEGPACWADEIEWDGEG